MSAELLEVAVLKCSKLEVLIFTFGDCREPVPIFDLYFKIVLDLSNLKLLYLPEFYVPDLDVKSTLTENGVKFIKVQNKFYVNSTATNSDLSDYLDLDLEHETHDFEETEIF